jgi:hypothetical protein
LIAVPNFGIGYTPFTLHASYIKPSIPQPISPIYKQEPQIRPYKPSKSSKGIFIPPTPKK